MAEALAASIATGLITQLVDRSRREVGKVWGVNHEIEKLKDVVDELQSFLDDAEKRYYQSRQIQEWLEKLKSALYDAQDVLEEFNRENRAVRENVHGLFSSEAMHNETIKKVSTFFSSPNQLAFKLKMSRKVRAVREKIEAIKAAKDFHLDERMPVERDLRMREQSFEFTDEDIIGRDDEKKAVKEFLLDSNMTRDVSILRIVGIGGLGKTALAQRVYNDKMVSKHFTLKMWVCVSNDFDVKKIVTDIIIAFANKKALGDVAMEQLQSELRAVIDGKRYLLVLDDLWNEKPEKWLNLKRLLVGGARGSKILVTTRNHSVAEMTVASTYVLKGLSVAASLDLLLQVACQKGEEIQDTDMLALGEDIARKCFGVPLVIRTVGSLLFFKKTRQEWSHFKDHELPKVSQTEDSIKSALRLSYDHLPSHLKQCFAFCSLFPKDYEIKKQTLINLWMAEGFIQPSNRCQQLEDIADRYFMDLLWGNFFQDFKKDPFTNKETCKMPALMHDLACLVAGSECWVAWKDTEPILERTRHISHGLTSNLMGKLSISRLKASEQASSLRTFLSAPTYDEYDKMEQREPTGKAYLRQLIQSFKRLRILDLHTAIVKKVPRSICKLKHLTYLDLSHNNALKRLPTSITKLHNLQTLNLQGCSALEELPRDIRKLVNLRNLDIDHCYSLSYVPRGLEQLLSLHKLTRFILPKGKALTENYCGLGELNRLNDLSGSLSIENLGHLGDALEEYRAANLMEKRSLESLILKWGYLHTDGAVIGNTDEALLDGLRPHSNLQKLTIDGYEGKSFPNWMKVSLVNSLPNLVEVRLLRCGRCKRLPQLGRLPHLKSLKIWRLTELEKIDSDHSPTSTTSFPSLLRLEIRYCENLKAMPPTPHLEELILKEVNRELINQIVGLNKLKVVDRELHLLIGLNKLKSLDISQMDIDCLPEECLQSLASLERLTISECPRLTSFSHGIRHLSNLLHLSFSNCEELDLSKDESDNILFKSLRFVDILGVPKLASLPQWLLHVSNLERLSITKCLNLKALPEQIKDLHSLQHVEIIRCPLLTSLPEGMKELTSLTHLKIAGCPDLEQRCEEGTGEDWKKIAHIPHRTHKLEYYECL